MSTIGTGSTYTKYLGNSSHKEIHRMDKVNGSCHVNEILVNRHAVAVTRPLQLIKKGWDFCAHCWGKDLSER
ncbi:MAG: hypothetical protein HYU63_02360 [Armatimonadetes bacterium]|nr:hypothetical protein [Armatimonadota bacterium]